jgi:hypothetical protein
VLSRLSQTKRTTRGREGTRGDAWGRLVDHHGAQLARGIPAAGSGKRRGNLCDSTSPPIPAAQGVRRPMGVCPVPHHRTSFQGRRLKVQVMQCYGRPVPQAYAALAMCTFDGGGSSNNFCRVLKLECVGVGYSPPRSAITESSHGMGGGQRGKAGNGQNERKISTLIGPKWCEVSASPLTAPPCPDARDCSWRLVAALSFSKTDGLLSKSLGPLLVCPWLR